MGYYIEADGAHAKDVWLMEHAGARSAEPTMDSRLTDRVLVCVVDNGLPARSSLARVS